jgi:hypothetical protein
MQVIIQTLLIICNYIKLTFNYLACVSKTLSENKIFLTIINFSIWVVGDEAKELFKHLFSQIWCLFS